MEHIDHYTTHFPNRPGQWTSPYSAVERVAVMDRNMRVRLGERLLLELGLWSMLGLVALVVLASRYLAPALLIGAVLGAAGLIAIGLR